MTIPASQFVQVLPNVLSAGGNALVLNGLMLTNGTRVPIGQVLSFPNDGQSVAKYFGAGSTEASLAAIYFNGYNGSTQRPSSLLFAQYNTSGVAGYLRGGPVNTLTLAELQALPSGTLTIDVGGTPNTSASISLAGATSFSDAATIIEAAFTAPAFAVTYDSIAGAFVFTSTATGAAATIAYPTTDTLATDLYLTQATGAVLSQGADAAVPGTFMDAVVQITQNWAAFMTTFNPDNSGNANKVAFAAWVNNQTDRYAYVGWDDDITATESNAATTSFGYLITKTYVYDGTCAIYDPTNGADIAAFVLGTVASINFTAPNGRITFAFRGQDGLVAGVTDATAYNNLVANGYNCYAAVATANQSFLWFQPGSVSGKFEWFDSYVNQIWLNNALQLALAELLQNTNSVPYDQSGYELIKAACADPINAALLFGAIRAGVTLSSAQAAEINAAAGTSVSGTLQNQGWFLQVLDASPIVRQARQSPTINFWYEDGQSVQKIVLNSTLVQ
ncbi:MAG: DUF3383 domain-containing protein [Bradyrhizobium sp.]|nr:DUF3383 domain-containing protein [Bradyrhizobium sp.]